MITEDYCSFEVAKLLKEKGFDEVCTRVYIEIEGRWGNYPYQPTTNSQIKEVIGIMCSTHQMAIKWLREKYAIHIAINRVIHLKDAPLKPLVPPTYEASIQLVSVNENYIILEKIGTYEEAVEAALKYSLENLI